MKARSKVPKVKRSSMTWTHHPRTWLGGGTLACFNMCVPNMLQFHNCFVSVTQYKHFFLLNYWS